MDGLDAHSGELLILAISALVLATLMVIVPRLLQWHQKALELQNTERLKAIEQGHVVPPTDERCRAAGRTAMLVPMVVILSAATVTCFLVAYRSEHLFAVSLAVWCVAGVVSLAAITGGVALIGRLAQLSAGEEDEERRPKDAI
jgi:hypothetical protein